MINILDGVCTGYLGTSAGIPSKLAFLVTVGIRIIQIVVPILLIVWGMLDLGKAVMAQKEDEIKKGQGLFIKRLIAAILVFLVVFIVQIAVRFIASDDKQSIMSCVQCFINGKSVDQDTDPGNAKLGCWLSAEQ